MKTQYSSINCGIVARQRKILPRILLLEALLVAGLFSAGAVAHAATLNNYFNFVDIGATNAVTNGIGGSLTISDYFGTNATVKTAATTLNSSGLAIAAGTTAANTGVQLPASAISGFTGDFTIQVWYTSPASIVANTMVLGGTTSATVDGNLGGDQALFAGYVASYIRPIIGNNTKYGATLNPPNGTGTATSTLYDYVITYSAATHTFSTYMDGAPVGTPLAVTYFTGLSSLTNGFAVGGVQTPAFGDNAAAVTVSDFLVYSGALSSPQVTSIHSLGVGASASSIQTALAAATSFTWNGGGADDNWGTGGNWVGGTAPGVSAGKDLVFAGSTRPTPNMQADYTVGSLMFSNNASSFTLNATNGNMLTLGGGMVNNSTNAQTVDTPVTLTGGASFNTAAGGLTLNSNIVNAGNTLVVTGVSNAVVNGVISGSGGLTKTGNGTLTLAGANTYAGATVVSSGKLSVPTGGVISNTGGNFAVGTIANSNAVLTISGGAVSDSTTTGNAWSSFLQVGNGGNFRGDIRLSAGSLNAQRHLILGNSGGYGAMTLSGGTLTIGSYFIPGFGVNSVGIFNQTGGAATQNQASGAGQTLIGSGNGAIGEMNISGGTFTATAGGILLPENGSSTGILNIFGSGAVTAGNLGVKMGNSASAVAGTLNLLGGTLTANVIQTAGGTSTVNFNGGILKASGDNATFLTGLSAAYVYGGGAIIDDGGYAITVAQPFQSVGGYGVISIPVTSGGSGYIDSPLVTITNISASGSGATAIAQIDYSTGQITNILVTCPGHDYGSGDTLGVSLTGGGGSGAVIGTPVLGDNTTSPGGLTKLGAGTLTLSGANTYTGPTKVLAGTLAMNTTTGGALGGGDLAVSNAAVSVDASGGTALSAGNLTLQGTNVLNFTPYPYAADSSSTCINLSGALSSTGTNYVNVSGIGLSVGVYHLITVASGTVSTNNFVLTGLPLGARGVLTNSTSTTLDFMITGIGQVLGWFGNPSSTPAPWDIGITADWTPDQGNSLTTYNEYFTNTIGDLVTFGQDGANTTDTNYVDLETTVVPASVTFNWVYPYVLTGAGSIGGITSLVITDAPSVFLGTSNSYTGGTFVYGGSLTITNDNALGVSSNGVTLGSDSVGSGTLQLNGVTSARNISLVGNSAIGVASDMASVVSGNITGTGTLSKSDYGTLTLSGIITNTGSLDFLTGTGVISGTVSVSGELWAGASSDSNSFGVLNIQPGASVTVPSWIAIGRGGYGILNMNGGTLTKGGDNGTHLTMAGAGSGETGILNLNGGLIQDATGDCWLGEHYTSVVNQNGGTLANTGGSVYLGRFTEADSTYNLNGGWLQTRSIIGNYVAVSNAVFNFNGGTLQAATNSSAFMQGLTAAYVTTNGAIIDSANFDITIAQALADATNGSGPGSLVKLGTGALTMTGASTFSGPVLVSGGSLMLTPSHLGTNAVTVADNATFGTVEGSSSLTMGDLVLSNSTVQIQLTSGSAPPAAVLNVGALDFNGTATLRLAGLIPTGISFPVIHYTSLAGMGGFNPTVVGPRGLVATLSTNVAAQTIEVTVTSAGGIVWAGTNSAPGLANVWDLNTTTNWLLGSTPTDYQEVAPPGDAVTFNDVGSGTVLLSNTVNPNNMTISNSAVNYTFQGTGQINSLSGLTKVGPGTATLNLSGTYSGGTVVSNGTLSLGANQAFANLTGDGTISTASGSPTLTENSSADTAFSGQVQGALNLAKNGTASLTLSGAANHTMANLSVNEGALDLPGGNVNVSGRAIVGNGNTTGALILSGTGTISTATGSFDIGNSDSGGAYTATGMVTVASGTTLMVGGAGSPGHYQSGGLNIGNGYNNQALCDGTMLVNGGNIWVTNDAIIGFAGASLGTLTISNGTFNIGPVSAKWFKVSQWDSSKGVVNVVGGALNLMNGSSIKFSTGNTSVGGTINQSGGNIMFYSDAGTQVGGGGALDLEQHGPAAVPPTNTYNLDGGVLTVPQIISSQTAGTRMFNFNGGTLEAAASSATFFASGVASAANVLGGGAIIDTSSNNITIGQALINDGVDQDGGLTKNGSGTLELNGVNTYTNGTTVNGGLLGGTGTIAGAVMVNSNGGLAPGSGGIGALTINGNLTLNANSTNVFEVDGTTSTNDQITAGAGVTYGGVLNIVPTGTFTNGQTFTLFSGAGAASASNFASIMGSPGSGLEFAFTNGVLSVVAGAGPGESANLTNSYDAGTHALSLSWPAGEGWRLQMQTNSLSTGLSTNWTYVTDGSISSTNITVDPAQPTVFYRLRYP